MPSVLAISGSSRRGSANSAVLSTIAEIAPHSETVTIFGGLLELPHYSPDADAEGVPLDDEVLALRAEIASADAVLLCTPEYAGALPAVLKNLLEWTVGGGELDGKPVAWINVAAPGRGENAHQSLRLVLGYVGARIVEQACVPIPVLRDQVGEDGAIADPEIQSALLAALDALVSATP